MANLNKVILAGNLTRDPQLSHTPNNAAVCKFGMAISRNWTDRTSGEKREETCFVDITAFGRQGEIINQYMSKGQCLLVEGRLQFSQWTRQDGQKRSKLSVVVESFQFLGSPGGGKPSAASGNGNGPGTRPLSDGPCPPANENDIPF